jgi:hypothetical protein
MDTTLEEIDQAIAWHWDTWTRLNDPRASALLERIDWLLDQRLTHAQG